MTQGRAVALTLGLSALLLGRALANTELDVATTLTGTPDLSAASTYTQNTTPTTASDITFTNAAYGTTTFTPGTAQLNIGTLNDLDATGDIITISGTGANAIDLFGGSNSVASANGGSAADLLYVATGATLSLTTTSPVSIDAGVSAGNLDVTGTYSQASGLQGGNASLVLSKTGAGTLTLSNSTNTVTASNFQISGGTLTLTGAGSSGGVLQNVSTITVGGTGATLLLNGSSDVLGYTAGKEALVINSGGSVLNNGTNDRITLQNTVTMTGGTLGGTSAGAQGGVYSYDVASGNAVSATSDASGNSALISAQTALQLATTFNVTRGTGTVDLTVSAPINGFNGGGGSGLTKTGNGILLLRAFNTYTSATTISAGTLQLGNGTNSGTVASASIVDNAALLIENASNQTYGGVISGTGTVTVANAGGTQEVVTNANTYTGTTTITSGTLQLGSNAATGALSPSSAIVDNGTFIIYRSNAVVQGTDFSSGPISGTGSFVQGGSGTTTLNAANTFSGTTQVQGSGALILANANAIQNSTLSGGPVQFDQSITGNSFTLGGLSGSTNLTLANNATTPAAIALSVGNNNASTTYSGVLSGAGSLIKIGTGNLTLSSNSTYTGTTTVNAGTLTLSGGGNANGTLGGSPSVTVNSGGTLALTASDTLGYTFGKEALFINGTGIVTNSSTGNRDTIENTITMVGGTLTSTAGNAATNGAYSLNVTGGGLNVTSDANGLAATISGSPISLQSTSTVFNVTRGSTAPAVDANISAVIENYNSTGGVGFTKTGNGILQLSGADTFTGGLRVQAGTVLLTGSLASQPLTLGASGTGAAFNYNPSVGGTTQTLGNLSLAGGANSVSASAGNTLALGTISRTSTGVTVNFNPASTGTITTTTANDSTGIISAYASYGSGTGLSYATASGGASPYTIAAYTAGTTYTSGNAFSSGTNYNITGSTTTSASASTANTVRYTGAAGTLTIPAASKLTTAGLMNAGTGTLTISGPTVTGTASGMGIGAGSGTLGELVVFGNTQGIVFNTSLVDNYNSVTSAYNSSAVTFNTAGTVTLNAVNTYRGATSVLSGTVVANATNALATTSGIAVSPGATFSVTANSALFTPVAPTTTSTTASTPGTVTPAAGQVAVPVTLSGGTLLRNGTGVSLGSGTTVGAGMLTLTAASTLDFGTTGVGTLNLNSFTDASNSLLTVLDFTHPSGSGAGTDGTDDRLILNEPLTAALLSDISFNGTAAQQITLGNGEYEILPMTAVPEPSTWMGGLLMVGALCGSRLRRLLRRS